jgi:hypothetical protein
VSIASKKTKEVRASTEGVESRPIMWPQLPKDDAEWPSLREAVLNNPLIYGPYVSIDLKATLITADFLIRKSTTARPSNRSWAGEGRRG